MNRRFSLSLLIAVLALAVTGYSQPRDGRQETRKPSARVDSTHVERTATTDDEDGRNVYTDDDVLKREPRDSRLGEVESLEMQCFNEVNRVRVGHGLTPLAFNEALLHVARDYSRRMAEGNFLSHNDPEGRTVRERVSEANIRWRMLGENLSSSNGYINPVAASMTGWMDSPTHRRNLLDRGWRQTAIGAWISANGTVYFTEIFLTQ